MTNFYHRFNLRLAQTLIPLYALLSTTGNDITWTAEAEKYFLAAKKALSDTTGVPVNDSNHPRYNGRSEVALAGVLEQFVDNRWCPLSFFRRKYVLQRFKYSASHRKLLAIYLSIKHFSIRQGFSRND